MELENKIAVVTGGASGIGRALVFALVAADARMVVVADRDAELAREVAAEAGPRATAIVCDVAVEREVNEVIDRVEERFGTVDLYAANAGVGSGLGLEASDEAWEKVLGVNLRAQLYAARRLVPTWVERGHGYFVSTASAAGLLTQIGDAPYAVTKHAAVAFAEWLAVTYGHRGLRVSCLCPMGVDTPMFRGGLAGTGTMDLGVRVVAAAGSVLAPDEVAQVVLDAVREERFLILPHPEVLEFYRRKGNDYDRWLAGMQRLQARISETSRA